jgi:glycosyltransferase involved in cell wall biosynthesis
MDNHQIKIAFVAPLAYPILANKDFKSCGGAEVQQVLIAKALVDRGHRVTFIVKDYGQNAIEYHDGIEVVRCPFRYLGGSNIYFPFDAFSLVSGLKKINADVNLLKTPCELLFAMAVHRRLFGGRLIKLIAHDNECIEQPSGAVSRLYAMGIKGLDYTVFQTLNQKEIGGRVLGLNGSVIKNIAHWHGSTSINVASDEKDIDVLWVGTCNRHKQPEVLLELAQAMPDTSFTMIIAPGLDREFNQKIETKAKSIRNLSYIGFVKYQEIDRYYSRAKILVQTSLHEGFPNVFLQAWQFETPVVSLNVDPDEIIVKNRLGLVSGNIRKLQEDVHYLLTNGTVRRDLGAQGKIYLQDNHSVEVIAQQYVDMFNLILKKTLFRP